MHAKYHSRSWAKLQSNSLNNPWINPEECNYLRVPISTNFDTYGLYPNSNPPPVHCTATIFIVNFSNLTSHQWSSPFGKPMLVPSTASPMKWSIHGHIYNPCHYHHLPCLTLYGNPIIIIIIFLPLAAKWYHLNAH